MGSLSPDDSANPIVGIQETKPIAGMPENVKYKVKMRADDIARIYVKIENEITEFILLDNGKNWLIGPEVARTVRSEDGSEGKDQNEI